jgi:hypothetical protein
MDEPVDKPAKVTTEQFRVIVAMCMVVITACLVFGAIQLRQIKIAEQQQACGSVVYYPYQWGANNDRWKAMDCSSKVYRD